MTNLLYSRIMQRVNKTETCWVFRGALSAGYPSIRYLGKTYQGHRIVIENHRGPRPDGLIILHTCSNRACVNPQHLVYGTQQENLLQARKEGALPFNGLVGISYDTQRNRWIARAPISRGKYKCLYQGQDFFEACCRRKSWENRREEHNA